MTQIEWTHRPHTRGETWNPLAGCSIVSPGCTNCYAMRMAARIVRMSRGPTHYDGTTRMVRDNPVWTGKVKLAPEHILLKPLKAKAPRTYFVNSMSDLFHEDVPDEWIDRVFAVMALTPHHTFLVLTKRAERMKAYVTRDNSDAYVRFYEQHWRGPDSEWCKDGPHLSYLHPRAFPDWPLSNLWLGVSAERQQEADARIPDLLATPAAVRFVSAEPLLGPIRFDHIPTACLAKGAACCHGNAWLDSLRGIQACERAGAYAWPNKTGMPRGLDWIIVGGESGPGARPMALEWARAIRDQCARFDVPFFMKQVDKKQPIPADLEVRQWPRVRA